LKALPTMKKRGQNEGSISKRQDGTWQAIISVGKSAGKRIRKWVYGKTRKEVAEKLTRLQTQKLDGQLLTRERLTVAELLDRWLSHWSPDLAASSRHRYQQMADNHIKPHLGSVIVEKLQALQIRALLDKLADDGRGERTRQYVFATLRRAFTLAVRLDLATVNPCSKLEPPRSTPKRIDPPNADQIGSLFTAAEGSEFEAVFVLAAMTGLRQGELFALSWQDIDLERRSLTVQRSLEEVRGKLALKEPKSAAGRRSVRLPQVAVDVLHEHRKRLLAAGKAGSPWVFTDADGGFLRKSNFQRRVWDPLKKAAGLTGVRFHDLRHAHASMLLRQNTHVKIVQERLGHSTIKLTMDTYSHLLADAQDEAQDEAADAMDRLFLPGGGNVAVNKPDDSPPQSSAAS